MKYYVREIPSEVHMRGAWGKARKDINTVLDAMGYKPLDIPLSNKHNGIHKLTRNVSYAFRWKRLLSELKFGDTLVIQYPPLENSIVLPRYLNKLSQKGIKIVSVIHDLVSRVEKEYLKQKVYSFTEPRFLNAMTDLIVHNEQMEKCVPCKPRKIRLGIFDYIIEDYNREKTSYDERKKDLPIIIAAGSLARNRNEYLYQLPADCEINLYGGGYEENGKSNVHYQGAFSPEELPYILNGSFGLVWYGDSIDTCSGSIGEYVRICNPHRTSLYLACGFPVIVWHEAAMASFVLENHCGIVVNSLQEIAPMIANMSEDEYCQMKKNAEIIGEKLRAGYFFKTSIEKCES